MDDELLNSFYAEHVADKADFLIENVLKNKSLKNDPKVLLKALNLQSKAAIDKPPHLLGIILLFFDVLLFQLLLIGFPPEMFLVVELISILLTITFGILIYWLLFIVLRSRLFKTHIQIRNIRFIRRKRIPWGDLKGCEIINNPKFQMGIGVERYYECYIELQVSRQTRSKFKINLGRNKNPIILEIISSFFNFMIKNYESK